MKTSKKVSNPPDQAESSFDGRNRGDYKSAEGAWLGKSAGVAMRILDALEKMGISQFELARRLDVSRQYVSKIIKGKENLTLETIARIEAILGVTLLTVPEDKLSYSESHVDYETRDKIKPIIYHSFAEKEQLEKDMMSAMSEEKRNAVAASLMSIFHTTASGRKRKNQAPKKL